MKMSDQAIVDDLDDDEDDPADMPQSDFAYDLNRNHFVQMKRRGEQLLVVFETLPADTEDMSAHETQLSELADEMNWSVLTLTSRGVTWFRDEQVVAFFDAMVDGTLLDSFDDVLLYGAGPAGHAALSFAICAPLSRVLALAPHTAMSPDVLEWDTRFPQAAKIEFGDRYPPSRASLGVLDEVYAAYDPEVREDARHARMLEADTVLPLMCRRLGSNLERVLVEFGILEDIVSEAMEGTLNELSFYRALRARRQNPAYLRGLVSRLDDADRPYLEALAVRNIYERQGRRRFARRFKQLEEQLAKSGTIVPPSRNAKSDPGA